MGKEMPGSPEWVLDKLVGYLESIENEPSEYWHGTIWDSQLPGYHTGKRNIAWMVRQKIINLKDGSESTDFVRLPPLN